MPDRDPMSMLCMLQGEEVMLADRKRRAAQEKRRAAESLERQAAWHDERRVWFQEAIDALAGVTYEYADPDSDPQEPTR